MMVSASVNRCCTSCAEVGRDLAESQLHHALLDYAEAVAYERAMRRRMWIGIVLLAALFLYTGFGIWVMIR